MSSYITSMHCATTTFVFESSISIVIYYTHARCSCLYRLVPFSMTYISILPLFIEKCFKKLENKRLTPTTYIKKFVNCLSDDATGNFEKSKRERVK